MNFNRVRPVFELIILAIDIKRQLAFLADRHKACAKLYRHGRAKDKAARVNTRHIINALIAVRRAKLLNSLGQRRAVGQQGRNIAIHDALFREIRDRADGVS